MFKIESYITPLLMGYLDKYVKLRPEDFQLSLWGGDAVLYNLDLRLDIIEKAMQLPIVFQSGHIHELRLHVPWTKLGSDPVVVTINTIECILKLRDTAYSDKRSSRAGSETPRKSGSAVKQRSRRQGAEDLPPGYLQSLMNKITNNVSIIVNNLIVKFVEDDIVLSINVKSAECYSVNSDWNRCFVELSAPDYVLRRAINFCDLTACLDKRDGSGKIENYQDPMVYRCSVSSRMYTKYENVHAKYPVETKMNVYCERLDLSLTDTQLPMLIRLIELCLAIYYGTLEFKNPVDETESDKQDTKMEISTESSVGEPPPENEEREQQQGWASWAWSYVPQIIPEEEEEEENRTQAKKKRTPPIFTLGMYAYKMTLKFKLTEYMKEKAHYGPKKIVFQPFLYLEAEGISTEMLMQGITFFDCQFGITNLRIYSQGICICGAEGEENGRNNVLLSGGDLLANKTTTNYMCQSLFDQQSPENLDIPISKILDFDEHKQVYTEQYGMQKYGVFWMDYLYSMHKPEDNNSSSKSSVSSLDESDVFVRENSLSRFVVGQCHLNVSSTTVHRVQKLLDAAYRYEYDPYAKKHEERVDENRPHPTEEQLKSMEEFIPTRTYHLTFLQPVISVLSAEHAHCDIKKKVYRSHGGQKNKSAQGAKLPPLFGVQLSSQRFDLQVTSAMYPRKLIQLVSKIAGPSSNLLHHCHSHSQMKLFGFHVGLTRVDGTGSRCPLLTIVPPTSGAMYTRRLLLPMYWKNSYLPKQEKVYELPQMSLSISKCGLLVVMAIVSSWKQTNPKPDDIHLNSLLEDAFPQQESDKECRGQAVMEVSMSGFELKTCKNDLVTACTGTLSSMQALLYKNDGVKTTATPILFSSSQTDTLHTADWLLKEDCPLVEEVTNEFLTFTYQLPRQHDHIQAPAVVLLNLESISCCLDPVVMDWLSYTPTCKVVQSAKTKVEVDLELAKAASPLQGNISQVSVASSGSKQHTLSFTRSPTTGQQSTVPTIKQDTKLEKKQPEGLAAWFAQIFPLVRVMQVQVEVKKACLFFPKSHIDMQDPTVNIVRNIQTLGRSRSLVDMVIVCLPQVTVQSAGLKTVSYLQEIPISSMEGSLVGEKIPWNVGLRNFCIYTVHCNPLRVLPLLRPVSVSCTVGVSYKYTPPTSDNISALGLCLHTDMHAVKVSTSFEQIKLLMEISSQGVKLTSQVTSLLASVSKSLAADKTKVSVKEPQPAKPMSKQQTQTLSATSVTEGDLPYTQTSGDVTSLDTTPSREMEILDNDSEGVKLSLWLQWTLPKFEMCLYMKDKEETKLSVLLEDLTMSVDIQDVYSKLKVNMGAANVLHYHRTVGNTVWEVGLHEGVLMNCRDNLSRDTHIVSSRLWTGDQQRTSAATSAGLFQASQPSRELTHGFLSLTFTRALRKNVKRRMQKLNIEIPVSDENHGTHNQFFFHKYVSEICINLNPCDFILCTSPFLEVGRSLATFDTLKSQKLSRPSKAATQSAKGNKSSVPFFNSSNIPLIYADVACVRLFLPGERICHKKQAGKGDHLNTTIDHDMCMIQVQSLNVTPHADNPLPRYAVDRELFQRAVQLGVTSESGAALSDRQYQVDVKKLSISTGCWDKFIQHDADKKKSTLSPSIQIPAVEWNSLKAFQHEDNDIQLFPIVSPCDLKLVAVPAVVNSSPVYGSTKLLETLVCGYALEVNIISDLDLHISTNQIHLLQTMLSDTLTKFKGVSEKLDDHAEDKDSVPDSGIGSEVSATTNPKSSIKPQLYTPTEDQQQTTRILTPVDVLLTAGRISCTVYTHKVVEQDLKLEKKKSANRKKGKKPSKIDLEWHVNPGTEGEGEVCDDVIPGQGHIDNQDSYFMNMYNTEASASIVKTIPAGSTCINPFLFLYISQPHTVVSCHTDAQKFEMSCYDILIKGPAEISIIPASDIKLLPDCSDYTQYWLETRAGQPNHVTGIPPSLYTLTVTNFLQQPASVSLKLERPIKTNVSFMRMYQVEEFLQCLLPSQMKETAKPSTNIHSSTDSKTTASTLAMLSKVSHVELSTEQIVVALETKSCDENPSFITSFSNLNIEIDFQQNAKREVARVVLMSYMRDLLLKTVYSERQLPLIGPCSIKMDATLTNICHDNTYFLSQSVVTIATGLVTLNLGQEHILCLKMVGDHIMEYIKKFYPAPQSRDSKQGTREQEVEKDGHLPDSLVVHMSSDDLRSEGFQYIMDQDVTGEVPNPGEIIFCNKDMDGNSTMTWSYSHPRVISNITSTPIPFHVSESQDRECKVQCTLQYWEVLIQQFVDYVDLEISDNEVTQACLPDIRQPNTGEVMVAQTWRIAVINPDSDDVVVLPASLAAAMKIDSMFVPSLIPVSQVGCTAERVELHLSNHIHCLGKETPTKLKPFFMSSCYPATGEFAVLVADNILFAGSHISGRQVRTQMQFTSRVMLDLLEFKTLTMQRVISPFEINGTASIQQSSKPVMVDIDVTCEPVTLKLGQGVIHNITASSQAWNQILSDKSDNADEVIFSHYIICNDTQQPIRFGQVGTDENLVLQPREMHQYRWRSHKMKQELHVCLDGTIWKWCDPLDINKPVTMVRQVMSPEQKYTLIITVKQLSNVQNQIIISGQLTICNRLSQHLEVKVVTNNPDVERRAVLGSELTVPSYILEPQDILGVKFRPLGTKGMWSKDVYVAGTNLKESNLVKITLTEKSSFHVWCRVFTQKVKMAQQIVVVVCPLYSVRSHLPNPLFVNIDTSKLNIHQQIEAPGQGRDLQLMCAGGDIHHSLTFQFSPMSGKSNTGVTLSTGLIDQLERAPVPSLHSSDIHTYWKQEPWFKWPYGQEVKIDETTLQPDKQSLTIPELEMGNQPTIDLNISLSELWPGCPTVLVDIKPAYLVNNMSHLDLIIMGTEDVTYDLLKGQTLCLPKLEGSFHVGVKLAAGSFMSASIPVSDTELGAQRYRNDVGKTLYLDSFVHMPVFADVEGQTQVYFFTVCSLMKQQIQVITVRERFCFTNLTKYNLTLCPFTLPGWSGKVDIPINTVQQVSSHLGCHRDQTDLYPLTFHPLLYNEDSNQKHEVDHTTEFVHYLSMKNVVDTESGKTSEDQSKLNNGEDSLGFCNTSSDWSFPLRLLANENGCKMTSSIAVESEGEEHHEAICVIGHIMNGVTFFTIQCDQAPTCFLKNKCEFELVFGQTLMNLSLSGITIQEQTELVNMLPTLTSGGATYYTPPHISTSFPQINDKPSIPKIHISGFLPNDTDRSNLSNLKWSQPIDLLIAADNFVTIPGLADVKVHVQQISMITYVTVEPITKADVSAKEIRSRLKGKERTIVMETKELELFTEDQIIADMKSAIQPEQRTKKTKEDNCAQTATIKVNKAKPEFSIGVLVKQLCFVIQDEISSPVTKTELLRLTVDDLFVASYPASDITEQSGNHRNCVVFSAGDIQLDNQVQLEGNYDFPVVIVRQDFEKPYCPLDSVQIAQMNILEKHAVLKSCSIVHVQILIGKMQHRRPVLESVEIGAKPLNFYIDDTFIFRCMKEVEGFIPIQLSRSEPLLVSVWKLPKSVKCTSQTLSCPVSIRHLSVQPLTVLLSVHASLKVFIASDHTPLSFGKFEKTYVCTSSYQLIRVLAMHYASGALFRAGAVVGSLEILGNPTGLVRSIGTGIADFFRMPYRGLTRGPGAFVVGVSHGTSSMVKNITTGMLKSVTNFASSVSRNMDRLSLDTKHVIRQEENRRHRPDGVGDGLIQGLTGLGMNLLGAVAGLADQPIQSLVNTTEDTSQSKTSAASNIVTGMGKGLMGVFTKPIGGAAEFVSQTGQGILQGTGLSEFPKSRFIPVVMDIGEAPCGQLKYTLKLLQSLPSNDILCCVQANFVDLTDSLVSVTLILTPEILFVMNHEEDSQQQSFSIAELECGVSMGDNPILSLIWRDSQSFQEEQRGMSNDERVTAFIDGTTCYVVPHSQENLSLNIHNNHTDQSDSAALMEQHSATDGRCYQNHAKHLGDLPNDRLQGTSLQMNSSVQGRQLDHSVIQEGQLSDSETDSSSVVMENNTATLPQYDFHMSPTKLAAFLAVFNITKHKLEGSGFAV